jgi:hypothetical protein
MMNERIRELAEQAGFGVRENGSEVYTSKLEHLPITEEIEKFALLIVRELVSTLAVEGSDLYHNEYNDWGAIKVKYFVDGDPNKMLGEELWAQFTDGFRGTGRYRLNERFVEHLMQQHFGVE